MRKSHNPFFEMGSIPLVGSSNNIIFELPINANAAHNFLFCPPDKVLAKAAAFSDKPIFFIKSLISSTFAFEPFISHIYCKC